MRLPAQLHQFLSGLLVITCLSGSAIASENADTDTEEDEHPMVGELDWPEAEFPPAEVRSRGLNADESFVFRMQWGMFRKAGTTSIQTETVTTEDGETALAVTSHTQSHGLINSLYPVTLKTVSLIDTDEWRLQESSMHGNEGSRLRDMETVFDYEEGVMRHVDEHYPDRTGVWQLPYPTPLDDSSTLLQMRGWTMELGERQPLLVSSKGKLYLLEMEIKAKETVKSKFGKRTAYRIEPVSAFPESRLFREGGHFTVWISADAERIPLRFDIRTSIGIASMILDDYTLNANPLVAEK